jgi:hypothetical protein
MSNSTAEPQAGVFAGLNPAHFNPNDPIVLFIIQVETIIKPKKKKTKERRFTYING